MTNPLAKPTTGKPQTPCSTSRHSIWLKHLGGLLRRPTPPSTAQRRLKRMRNTSPSDSRNGGLNNDHDALSAKVWRYSGEKWSRMSEEIPLHRLGRFVHVAGQNLLPKPRDQCRDANCCRLMPEPSRTKTRKLNFGA